MAYRYKHGWIPVGGIPTGSGDSSSDLSKVDDLKLHHMIQDAKVNNQPDKVKTLRAEQDRRTAKLMAANNSAAHDPITGQLRPGRSSSDTKVDLSKVDDAKLHEMLQHAKANNQPDLVKILRSEQDRRTAKLMAANNSAARDPITGRLRPWA